LVILGCAIAAGAQPQTPQDEFSKTIRPTLLQNCAGCHNPKNPKNHVNFLKAETAQDMERSRGLWRNVAAQMRNRTMPPAGSKLSEDDRLRVSNWIDERLRKTACDIGDYAGAAAVRRLNRREYHNTIRDLLGIDFNVSEIFPGDGTGGAGFDTNGETLFIPPLLMERYMEAAQQISDRAIISPKLLKTYTPGELEPVVAGASSSRTLAAGQEFSAGISVYLDGDYDLLVPVERLENAGTLLLKVDGLAGVPMIAQPSRGRRPPAYRIQVRLGRGLRMLGLTAQEAPVAIQGLTIEQKVEAPSSEQLAVHYRLLGVEPGDEPLQARNAAKQILRRFLRKAYRRPVQQTDIDRLLVLYDRAAQRGDPFEERMKLVLRAVLVGPDFLFKIERRSDKPGIHLLGQHELAVRLSYFLWSTMPDEELYALADHGLLQDSKILAGQVERMLDDPRARTFTSTFIGQWLGTQELGGRLFPMLTELQAYYNPPVAADLRAEPVLLFENILHENGSLLDLLTANYTFLTQRTVKFYQLEDKFPNIRDNSFHKVQWPDNRRAGVTGMASVMAMTSHYRQSSPVLRGAWVLETLLGTKIPPPPPDVPQLEPVTCKENCVEKAKTAAGMRQKILEHRVNPACSACHNLMDPIGFALENFDWTGRWRDKESNGSAIDASGSLPSGEHFNGPEELRQVLVGKKDEFLRHLTGKMLGYALGRSLQDGDSCTVQRMADMLQKDNYRARTLIREVVLSTPFRNSQGGEIAIEAPPPPPRKTARPMVVK
jgi:cytochrome c553